MRSTPAYSLIFAFVIMTVMMLIAATTITNVNERLAYYRNMEGPVNAKLAAESAAENGVGAMKDFNPGYESSDPESFCEDPDGDGVCNTYGSYTVFSRAQELDSATGTGLWYTPIPGTGTAGDPDQCSIMNTDEEANHPCNWNKLLYGQSVTIPLYSDNSFGGTLNPADLGMTGWELRMRTPCADGSLNDANCTRYVMDDDDSTGTFDTGGDTVVFWQLVGEKDTDGDGVGDETLGLVPVDTSRRSTTGSISRNPSLNTEIYESLINTGYSSGDYFTLKSEGRAPYDLIHTMVTDPTVTKLSLQLNIVTALLDETGSAIPYLEWQLISNASDPFGDNKAVIVGEGYHQGEKGVFYFPYVVKRSTTGESTSIYTLSN